MRLTRLARSNRRWVGRWESRCPPGECRIQVVRQVGTTSGDGRAALAQLPGPGAVGGEQGLQPGRPGGGFESVLGEDGETPAIQAEAQAAAVGRIAVGQANAEALSEMILVIVDRPDGQPL